MSRSKQFLALDIGTVRIGVAVADGGIGIPVPYGAIAMREPEFRYDIAELVAKHAIDTIIIGYPRNQSGGTTQQTSYVEQMAKQLEDLDAPVIFQDESLTSVLAEERLKANGTPVTKEAIDAEAATIILQDYLDQQA